jgi:phosphoglycerol geranylgeranyltransferase
MALADLARRFERLAGLASVGVRRLLGLDTNPVPAAWTHVTKVDPEREKRLPLAYPLYLSQTSAVSVGGSREVTDRNTEETFDLLAVADVPTLHEPSAPTHVTDQTREHADFFAIPEVLNGDTEALVGTLGTGLDRVRADLAPDWVEDRVGIRPDGVLGGRIGDTAAGYLMQTAVFEAYIIMNTDSAAAREANVTEDDRLSPQEAHERALAAEYHLDSEIVYLEYSGTFGGDEAVALLEAIDDATSWSRVWYGGGLDDRERTAQILDAGADAVVVGDSFHDIAETEREVVERARETFDDPPTAETVEAWVAETVALAEATPTRYLATIPDVSAPEAAASEALAAAVDLVLRLDALAADLTDPDEATLRRELRERSLLGEARLTTLLGDETAVRRLALALLTDRFGIDDGTATRHLAVTL